MKVKYPTLFSLPYLVWAVIFIVVPMALVVIFAWHT